MGCTEIPSSGDRMRYSLRKFFCGALLGLLLGSLPGPDLFAQVYDSFRNEQQNIIREKSRIRIGPFRIYPAIRLSDFGYDNNVYRREEQTDPVSDFTFSVNPSIEANILFRDWLILSVRDNLSYRHFFKVKRERKWGNTVSPSMKILIFSRFALSGSYSHARDRRRGSSEFDVRADSISHNYQARLMYETVRGTSFGIAGQIRRVEWEDIDLPDVQIGLARALNREERSADFEFYYPVTARTRFFIQAGATEYRFDSLDAQWRDSISYQVSSGFIFPLLGRIRGQLRLGYKMLRPRLGDIEGFSGLIGDTSLDYRVGRFAFHFQYRRDSQFSYHTTNVYFITDNYTPGVSFYAARFLKLRYDLSYGENRYPVAEVLQVTEEGPVFANRKDIHRSHNARITVRIIGSLGIGVSLNWWEVSSNFYLRGSRKNFIWGLFLTQDF